VGIKASESIINKIKEFEGFSATPYLDAKTGKYAVGYGDTRDAIGPVSKKDADFRLRKWVSTAEQELSTAIKRQDLPQNRQDVMVDMHYNLGLPKMKAIIDMVNSGDDEGVGKAILEYVNTTDAATGKKFQLEALKKRAAYRAQLWNGGGVISPNPSDKPATQAESAPGVFVARDDFDLDLDGIVNAVAPQEPEPSNAPIVDDYFVAEMDDIVNSVISTPNEPSTPQDPKTVLDAASDATFRESSSQWLLRRSEAERISKKLGVSILEARDLLADSSAEDILARNANALTAQYFPAVSKWANNPDNYVMMKATGELPHRIELKTKALNTDSDFVKAIKSNEVTLKRHAVHLGMLMGSIDKNTGKQMLFDLDQRAKEFAPTKDPAVRQRIEKNWNDMEQAFAKIGQGKVFQGAYESVSSFLSALAAYAGNPSEYAQEIASSATSFAPSALTITGGLLASTGAGAVAGAPLIAGGAGLSLLMSFGARMDEQLKEYARPDGSIDYDKAFSDPEVVSTWRAQSAIYAGAMSVSDLLLGRVTGKIAAKGKGIIPKIKKIATASVIEEGGSELVASSAADAYVGKAIEKLPENLTEAVREAVVSPGFIAAGSAIANGSVLTAEYAKKGATKMLTNIKKSAQAKDRADTLAGIRQEILKSEDAKQNKSQVQELIVEAASDKSRNPEIYNEETEGVSDKEILEKEKIDQEGILLFTPSEFDEFITSKGFDPQVVIQSLSPEVQAEYIKNRETDSSVSVTVDEWLTFQTDDAIEGIDEIARFPDIGINAKEAAEIADDVFTNPASFLQGRDIPPPVPEEIVPPVPEEVTPPPVPGQEPSDVVTTPIGPTQIIEPTEAEGNIVMRPVQLLSKFRNKKEQRLMTQILAGLKRATKLTGEIPKESLDAIAEIQYSHLRFRAEVLGMRAEELMTMQFAVLTQAKKKRKKLDDSTIGVFNYDITTERLPYGLTKILISPDADLSTVTHELGHSWLHDMARDSEYIFSIPEEQLTERQREYKTAMQDTAELFDLGNISDILNLPKEQQTRIHETFAQTAEKYFYEGKFENNKFRIVLEHFRQFLKRIALSIGNAYKQYPPFKINPKIERIFETILGASDKVENTLYPMFPEPMFDANMLGADGAKYLEAQAEAKSLAVGEVYTEGTLKAEKERETEALGRLEEFRTKAENDVDAQPVFQTLKYFKDQYAEYVANGKKGTDPRLSFNSIAAIFFNGDVEAAQNFRTRIPREVMAPKGKGGIDTAFFMADNDIHDFRELMNAMEQMSTRDDLINNLVNQQIDAEIPMMKSDEEIHRIAEKAVQNKGKEKLLQLEMKILAEKYLPSFKGVASKLINPARYVGKNAKEEIERLATSKIMQSAAYKFSPKKFLVDSDRKGRSASKNFKSNDITSALEDKYQQMVDFKAFQEAEGVYAKLAKLDKDLRKIIKYAGKKAVANRYDLDLLNQGKRVIMESETGKISPISVDFISDASAVDPSMVKSINDLITRYNTLNYDGPRIKNNIAAALTYGELMNKILKTSSAAATLKKDLKSEDRNNVAEAISAEVAPYAGTIDLREGRLKDTLNIRWLMESLIGRKNYYQSQMFKLIADVTRSESNSGVRKKQTKVRIQDALKPIYKDNPGLEAIFNPIKRRLPEFVQKAIKFTPKPIAIPELGLTLEDDGQLVKFMTLMGSNSGAVEVLLRNGNTDIAYVLDSDTNEISRDVDLTKYQAAMNRLIQEGRVNINHINAVNEIWKIFSELHPELEATMRRTDNIPIGKIAPRSVTVMVDGKEVVLTGGYSPISVNADFKSATSDSEYMPLDTNGVPASTFVQRTNFTKERTGGVDPIDLDISTLTAYTNAAIDIIEMRESLSNFRNIMLMPQVKSTLEEKAPSAYRNVILPWFNRTTRQVYTEYSNDIMDRYARRARKGVNTVLYALNVASGLRQNLGLLQSSRRVSKRDLLKASAEAYLKPKAVTKEVLSKSPFMQERYDTSIKDAHRSIEQLDTNFDWVTWTDDKINALGTFFAQFFQQRVDLATWSAAYTGQLRQNKTEQEAIAIADDVVMRTQGSMAASALSNLQAGADLKKLFLSATNIPLINLNELGLELRDNPDNLNKAKGIASIMTVLIASPILLEGYLQAALQSVFGDDEEEEEDEEFQKEKRMAVQIVGSTISTTAPIVGRFVESYIVYGSTSAGPVSNVIGRGEAAMSGAKNLYRGVNLTDREKKAIFDMTSFITGSGLFTMTGRVQSYLNATKTEEEKAEERAIRRYQLQDLRDELD
jgi:GH24 family phage-related lysozyme (muramidase)